MSQPGRDGERVVPLSRQAGRAAGRWWGRHGDTVRRTTKPARKGWAILAGYLWIIGYAWVGVMLAVGVNNLTGSSGALVLVTAIGGGVAIGWWQARHRLARHEDPLTPPPTRFGLALAGWLALVALAAWAQLI